MKPFGPHHFFISSGLVKASNTISRGALNVREMTNGFWATVVDMSIELLNFDLAWGRR